MSRGVPAGSGCALYGPGPSRVKGAAHRCATACGPPLTREPLPAPGAGVIGQAVGLPDGCAQPEPAPLG